MPTSLPVESGVLPAILSALDGPVVLCDPQGVILKVNPAVERILGRPEEEILHRPCWQAFFREEEGEEMEALFLRMREGKVTEPLELVHPTSTGETVTIVWSHALVREPGGEVGLVLATGTDVTALRRLEGETRHRSHLPPAPTAREEALRSSEARFAGIVELASDAIIAMDEHHRVVIFNQGAQQIFGYRPGEILGRPLDELLPPAFRESHRPQVEAFGGSPVTARRMGQRRGISGLRKNGEVFPAEASILKLEVDGRRLFTVVLRDISDRVRREREERFLSEVSAELASSLEAAETLRSTARKTVETLADFCIIDLVETEGRVRRIEAVHREPGLAHLAEAFRDLSLDRSRPHLMSGVLHTGKPELVTEVTPEHLEARAQDPDHLRWLRELAPRSYLTAPLVARGRTLGALLCVRSTSGGPYDAQDLELALELGRRAGTALDNARLYREARDALQARDDVLGVVSHDLGNPLQAIFIGLEALERARGSRGEGRAGSEEYYLSAIRRSADVMERLIRDLLQVRRMEAGHLSLAPVLLPLTPLVEEALEVMDPLARVKSVEIRNLVGGAALPQVRVDGDRIQQVLSNLVGNAVKHTPEGGRVTLEGAVEDGEVRVSVHDTGPGIPQEELDRVFERFWTGSSGVARGIGLGLAIARGIVKAHGGRIWATSAPGEGSTFTFTLPLGEAGGEVPPAPSHASLD